MTDLVATELPPGVIAATKAGECARCGERYAVGTRARRYGAGLRPLGCGCHPVTERQQTAPTQPAEVVEVVDLADFNELSELRTRVLELERTVEHVVSLRYGDRLSIWRALNPDVTPCPSQDELNFDPLVCKVQDLEGADRELARVDGELGVRTRDLAHATGVIAELRTELAEAEQERDAARAQVARQADERATVERACTAPAAAAPTPAPPRPTPPPRPPSPDVFRDLSTTPRTHVCATAGCGHRDRFHDEDGCEQCACAAYTTEGH